MKPTWIKAAAAAALVLFGASAQASVIATDSTYGVFDGTFGTRELLVTTHGSITDVNITIEFSKCDDPPIGPLGSECVGKSIPFNNEIIFRLSNANGDTVTLVDYFTYDVGVTGRGRVKVTFDDEASAPLGNDVQPGTFRPVESLARFGGTDMFGTWSLYIQDPTPGDPLEYFSSSLEINANAPAAVPEPASLGMLGLGLLGMGAVRRRARKAR
jgi:hypothetical protein